MLIITLVHNLEKKYNLDKYYLLAGLFWGLFWGLLGGLLWGLLGGFLGGLFCGLLGGLFCGLFWGLRVGLLGGLFWGLGSLISVSLIASIKYFHQAIIIWIGIFLLIALAEIIFLFFDKNEPRNKDIVMVFTAKRKGIAYLESAFIILELNGLYQLTIRGYPFVQQNFQEIIKWTGYIGIGVICLAALFVVIWGYIKLNSLKFMSKK